VQFHVDQRAIFLRRCVAAWTTPPPWTAERQAASLFPVVRRDDVVNILPLQLRFACSETSARTPDCRTPPGFARPWSRCPAGLLAISASRYMVRSRSCCFRAFNRGDIKSGYARMADCPSKFVRAPEKIQPANLPALHPDFELVTRFRDFHRGGARGNVLPPRREIPDPQVPKGSWKTAHRVNSR